MAIPTPIVRNLNESGILRTMAIDLSNSDADKAAIIEVLRKKIYSDPILAPIREYATNGQDSHVEAGFPSRPLQVVLPTAIMPEIRIRDFGIGLTPDEIEQIYIKYGRSTKRATNSQTGQLGLGCKSAFAYGDNFLVVSYKEGVKTTYNLTISGVCSVIAAEPMAADDENGMEIVVPVRQDDIKEFQDKAVNFFKYWKVCPEITGGDVPKLEALREELSKKPLFSDDTWEIRPKENRYYEEMGIAVMGNVPYPINWSIISNKLNLRSDEKQSVLYDFIRSNKTILRFNIGDLDFSASRESLEYTEKTCKAVVALIKNILDSIFNILDAKIQAASSYWEALLIYNQIFGRDDEQIFHGDVHRLEKYYQGKFNFKGDPIMSGAFEHIEYWDQELGYSEKGWTDINTNPILTTFYMHRERLKQANPSSYNYNRIPASTQVKIVINDLEKPVLVKAMARWLMNKDVDKRPVKVYFLRFKDSAQKQEFFKKMHFDSVPVIYASSILGNVKEWLKASRVSSGVTGVRDPQTVRFVTPANRLNSHGYRNDISWDREEIDLKEEEGYFVALKNGNAFVNEREVGNLSSLSHNAWVLLTALGEPIENIYGIPDRNRNAKWFDKALESGQWTSIETLFKEKKDSILSNNSELAAKAAAFFNVCEGSGFYLGIKFCDAIRPLLKNVNGAMYKVCSEVSKDFRNVLDLICALEFFNLHEPLTNKSSVDFKKLFNAVETSYPMITFTENLHLLKSNAKNEYIDNNMVKAIADYVNMVDGECEVEKE